MFLLYLPEGLNANVIGIGQAVGMFAVTATVMLVVYELKLPTFQPVALVLLRVECHPEED